MQSTTTNSSTNSNTTTNATTTAAAKAVTPKKAKQAKKLTRKQLAAKWKLAARKLLAANKYTRTQIVAKLVKQFAKHSIKQVTYATFLSDAKNAKYCKAYCGLSKAATVNKATKVMFAKS